jgi:predicted nucleic acid-binding Zn ribbon protein
MAEKIPQHNHCRMCMKAIPVDKTLCSDECQQKYNALMKKKKLTLLFLWVMIIAFIVVIFVFQSY